MCNIIEIKKIFTNIFQRADTHTHTRSNINCMLNNGTNSPCWHALTGNILSIISF